MSVAVLCGIVAAVVFFFLLYAMGYLDRASDLTMGLIAAILGVVFAIVIAMWFYPSTSGFFGTATSSDHLIYDATAGLTALITFFGMKWLLRGGYEGVRLGRNSEEKERIDEEIKSLDSEIQRDIAREDDLRREASSI